MAFLHWPPNEEPRPRASAGGEVLRSTPLAESNNMDLLHPQARHGNVYYPALRKLPKAASDREAFDALTASLLTERCRQGTLEPAIVEAMALAIGLAR